MCCNNFNVRTEICPSDLHYAQRHKVDYRCQSDQKLRDMNYLTDGGVGVRSGDTTCPAAPGGPQL